MNVERHQAVIIGGGPAGLAAAIRLRQKGVDDVVVLEREHRPGGILRQCIHDGFGLTRFGETLSGPEYAQRFVAQAEELGITCLTDTTVLSLEADRTVTASGHAGIYTAGVAQEYINLCNLMVGREVVILGSGDIGLIMARRMTLEGAKVKCVAELMPYSGGLKRNIVQCLDDFGIPLKLSHTVVDIQGKERVTGVTIAQVDGQNKPIPGTEEHIPCDTLLLSVGLLPENELSKAVGVELSAVTGGPTVNESLETNIPGVFACGNVLHVHDLVDYVSEEAQQAGRHAAAFVAAGGKAQQEREIPLKPQGAARYTVPVAISPERMEEKLMVRFRVSRNIRKGVVKVYADDKLLYQRKRPVMAPGEMEQVVFEKQWFTGGEQEIRVVAEEEAQ